MGIDYSATKLVVASVEVAEAFYTALGLTVVSRNTGGEAEVRQQQTWLSRTGGMDAHLLILTRFLELPEPVPPRYPGEIWLCFQVDDVDATIRAVEAAGGKVFRAAQDRPEHDRRAAVVTDPEGHVIELVGPMAG
jgi:predicted enzyme related to lactoylglutathione lyase